MKLKTRPVVIEETVYQVPKGIARNNRNRAWQLKLQRNGEIVATGNFSDDSWGGPDKSLEAAVEEILGTGQARKVNKRDLVIDNVTVSWREMGKPSLIAAVADYYMPHKKRARSLYICTQRRLANGTCTEAFREKLVEALRDAWLIENQANSVPLHDLLAIRRAVDEVMVSEQYKMFCENGQRMTEQLQQRVQHEKLQLQLTG